MKSRGLTLNDLDKLKKLHDEYYSEFEFPEFFKYLNSFIIEDNDGIIMAGGIELVGEISLVTNKSRNLVTIGRALLEAKAIAEFTAKSAGIRDLYAFVNNDAYAKHLKQHGFVDGDKTLLLRVENGQKENSSTASY